MTKHKRSRKNNYKVRRKRENERLMKCVIQRCWFRVFRLASKTHAQMAHVVCSTQPSHRHDKVTHKTTTTTPHFRDIVLISRADGSTVTKISRVCAVSLSYLSYVRGSAFYISCPQSNSNFWHLNYDVFWDVASCGVLLELTFRGYLSAQFSE
jgi:hypothetical protein